MILGKNEKKISEIFIQRRDQKSSRFFNHIICVPIINVCRIPQSILALKYSQKITIDLNFEDFKSLPRFIEDKND